MLLYFARFIIARRSSLPSASKQSNSDGDMLRNKKFHVTFALGNESSRGRKFYLWNFRSIPGNESSQVQKFHNSILGKWSDPLPRVISQPPSSSIFADLPNFAPTYACKLQRGNFRTLALAADCMWHSILRKVFQCVCNMEVFVTFDCTGTLFVLKLWSSVSEGLWIWPEAAQRWQRTLQSTRSPCQWRGIQH